MPLQAGKVLAFEADDPNQIEALFQDADIRIIPLEGGAFRAKMKTATIGTLQLHHVSVTSKILTEGTTADCSTSLIFPSNSGGPLTFQGMTLAADEIMLHGPKAQHCAVGAACEISVIVLPTNLLEMELSACINCSPFDFHAQSYRIRMNTDFVLAFRKLILDALQIFKSTSFSESMDRVGNEFECSLLAVLCSGLTLSCVSSNPEIKQNIPAIQIIRKAREFFEHSGDRPVYLGELCRVTQAGARTLQIAFSEVLGVSPMRYLKLRRLHRVRCQLLSSSHSEINVKMAALQAGFWDLSRFAIDYKSVFNELPSQTPRS